MTPRGGPFPHLRLNRVVKVQQGTEVARLVHAGHSFRQAADVLGLSLTTAWRRYWFPASTAGPRPHPAAARHPCLPQRAPVAAHSRRQAPTCLRH